MLLLIMATVDMRPPTKNHPDFSITELFCRKCKRSDTLQFDTKEYDNGVDSDTGYHDTGNASTFVCECGNTGDVEGDLEHVIFYL